MTVRVWCRTWLTGYRTRRTSTVRQAEVHLKLIVAEFGGMQLSAVKPSHVKAWTAKLKDEGRADSYVYAVHSRLSQVMSDAVHDGVIARNPCSRRTSPRTGSQRPYVATTEQVWALYDAMPPGVRPAVLLGAFVGLRLAEAAALRGSGSTICGITRTAALCALPVRAALRCWGSPCRCPHNLLAECQRPRVSSHWIRELSEVQPGRTSGVRGS
jgi:hypothetical protein